MCCLIFGLEGFFFFNIFWILIPYEMSFGNILSSYMGFLFTLLIMSFDAQKFLFLMKLFYLFFSFVWAFDVLMLYIYLAHFIYTCSLHVSVSHFGNSHNISHFFIISIFVMVICDQ